MKSIIIVLCMVMFLTSCGSNNQIVSEHKISLQENYSALTDQLYKQRVLHEEIRQDTNLTNFTDGLLGADFICLQTNKSAKTVRYTSSQSEGPGETGYFFEILVIDCDNAYWIFESTMGRGPLYGPFASPLHGHFDNS